MRDRVPVWCQTCYSKAEVKITFRFYSTAAIIIIIGIFFYYNFWTQAFPQRDWGHLFKSCNITQTISLSEKAAKIIFPQLKAIIGLWLCFEKTNACDLLCRVFVVFRKQPANKERFRKTEEGLVTKKNQHLKLALWATFSHRQKGPTGNCSHTNRDAAKRVNSGQQDSPLLSNEAKKKKKIMSAWAKLKHHTETYCKCRRTFAPLFSDPPRQPTRREH